MRKSSGEKRDSSPRSTGPAGANFEVQVATHYALALLAQTEAFGLPGVIVDSLSFQRRGQGHPLDDIIINGLRDSESRCLEVQAKRSISFTESNKEFASVVTGIIEGRKYDSTRYFAVAIERTSKPIENGVQEVLELARHTISAENFRTLLETPGRGNSYMTTFVGAFKKHLADNGIEDDDTLFEILKTLSILTFDYARPNSIAEQHDRSRARQLSSNPAQGNLYDPLFGWLNRADSIGGETNRDHLIEALKEKGVEIARLPDLAKARDRIFEMSSYALNDIETKVCGQNLTRSKRREDLEKMLIEAETDSGIVEITGPGGAGKSGLLKSIAESRNINTRILVLAPDRIPPGGWSALRNDFQVDASAQNFFQDLACDGGGLVCIDGLDRIRDDGQRKTSIDIISTILGIKGITLLYTARTGWEAEASIDFGEELMSGLSNRRQLVVEGLDDNEAEDLSNAVPLLAKLLDPNHPAKNLARNPFILRRLLNARLNTDEVLSEAELAWDWWSSGAHSATNISHGQRHARRRALLCLAEGLLSENSLVDVSTQDSEAVATLLSDKVLVQISTDRVKFQHDLFTDWAIACALSEDVKHIQNLPLDETPPHWLSRGFELAFRRFAEGGDNDSWLNNIKSLEGYGAKSGWTGLALLALIRSEHVNDLLKRFGEVLIQEDNGNFVASLIRRVISSHGQNIETFLKDIVPAGTAIPKGLVVPNGPQWLQLILWCIAQFDRLPPSALSAVIDLFEGWLALSIIGEKVICPLILERLADVLIADIEVHQMPISRYATTDRKIRYAVNSNAQNTARTQLALYAHISPRAVDRYLNAIAKPTPSGNELRQLLDFPGHIPSTCPTSLSLAIQSVIQEDTKEDRENRHRYSVWVSHLEDAFVLGRTGISLFTAILDADRNEGINLICFLVRSVEETIDSNEEFLLHLNGCERKIVQIFSYGWSRGHGPSQMVYKALQALEFCGHKCVENGDSLKDVINLIVEDGPISGAILLVVVDLVLTHASLDDDNLLDLVSSPELLILDYQRAQYDLVDNMSGGFSNSLLNRCPADATTEEALSNRHSRKVILHDVIPQIVFGIPEEKIANMRKRLEESVERLGVWTSEVVNWTSPVFMASHAHRLTSKENYDHVTKSDDKGYERHGWRIQWPKEQWKWLQNQSSDVTAENEFFSRALSIRMSMDDDSKPVKTTVEDAQKLLSDTNDAAPCCNDEHDPNDPWLNRVAAAAFIARFGSEVVIKENQTLLSSIFDQTLGQKPRDLDSIRYDVMYSPHSLAISGIFYLASRFQHDSDVEKLLNTTNMYSENTVSALLHHSTSVNSMGDLFLCSVVRIGIQSCFFPRRKGYDEEDSAFKDRESKLNEMKSKRLSIEREFLRNGSEGPSWPSPPIRRHLKRTKIVSEGRIESQSKNPFEDWPDFYFDDRTAAVWLQLLSKSAVVKPCVAVELLRANQDWLINTHDPNLDDRDIERKWTRALFECAAVHAKSWSDNDRNVLLFEVLDKFSDEAFMDAAAAFLIKSDLVHIEGDSACTVYLVNLRNRLWAKLSETLRWKQHLWSSRGGRMEIHLNKLIAAFFFKLSYGFGNDTAYTKGLVESQILPFLPILTEIVLASESCPMIALLFLDVLELIEPKKAEPFLVEVASIWATDGDQRFWNELGIGLRVCAIAERAELKSLSKQWEEIADAMAATGVTAGEILKQKIRNYLD